MLKINNKWFIKTQTMFSLLIKLHLLSMLRLKFYSNQLRVFFILYFKIYKFTFIKKNLGIACFLLKR